jgi:exopolysaccharide biosynthesis protein
MAGNSSGNTQGIIANVISGITEVANSGIFKTIRDNAKRKKAQAIANAGGYNTLSDYQKSLIGYVNPASSGLVDISSLPGLSYSALIFLFVIIVGVVILVIRRRN